MAQKRDPYIVLGIQRGATDDEVRQAFRRLARQYHPDVNKEPGAEQRFKDINEANSILSNPQRRRDFDLYGAAGIGVNSNESYTPTQSEWQGSSQYRQYTPPSDQGFSPPFQEQPQEEIFYTMASDRRDNVRLPQEAWNGNGTITEQLQQISQYYEGLINYQRNNPGDFRSALPKELILPRTAWDFVVTMVLLEKEHKTFEENRNQKKMATTDFFVYDENRKPLYIVKTEDYTPKEGFSFKREILQKTVTVYNETTGGIIQRPMSDYDNVYYGKLNVIAHAIANTDLTDLDTINAMEHLSWQTLHDSTTTQRLALGIDSFSRGHVRVPLYQGTMINGVLLEDNIYDFVESLESTIPRVTPEGKPIGPEK